MSANNAFSPQLKRIGLLELVLLLLISSLASAAIQDSTCRSDVIPDEGLTFGRAVELALCNNADIQLSAATVRARAAQLGETRAEYYPTLTATATELRETVQYPGSRVPSSPDTALTVYGSFDWRLFDFGGRHADSRAASKLLEAALGMRDATVQKVLGLVVGAYFDAVTAKSLLESRAEDVVLARDTQDSATRRVNQGDRARNDELQTKTALARAALDLNRARGGYEKALAVLAYSIGLPTGRSYSVSNDSEKVSVDDERSLKAWLYDARLRHPAILAARAEVESAQAQVDSVRSSGRPRVDLQANYYANGFPQQGIASTRQRTTTVGIAITIPLFDGFLSRYKVREAQANVAVKEASLIDTERVTLTEIIKAYSDSIAAVANLRDSQSLLEAAEASQSSSKHRYDAGAADILELLNTQAALADARQEYVRCLAEWRSARLRLLATSGVLSSF